MGSLRSAFVKVNSDPNYRAKFIKDPVGTIRKEGLKLSTKQQTDLKALIRILNKHLPDLGELPAGYDVLLDEVEGKHAARQSGDPGPLMF